MQNERVSVVMGIFSGLMMVGTSHFHTNIDFIGTLLILFGSVLLVKKQFIDLQYWGLSWEYDLWLLRMNFLFGFFFSLWDIKVDYDRTYKNYQEFISDDF